MSTVNRWWRIGRYEEECAAIAAGYPDGYTAPIRADHAPRRWGLGLVAAVRALWDAGVPFDLARVQGAIERELALTFPAPPREVVWIPIAERFDHETHAAVARRVREWKQLFMQALMPPAIVFKQLQPMHAVPEAPVDVDVRFASWSAHLLPLPAPSMPAFEPDFRRYGRSPEHALVAVIGYGDSVEVPREDLIAFEEDPNRPSLVWRYDHPEPCLDCGACCAVPRGANPHNLGASVTTQDAARLPRKLRRHLRTSPKGAARTRFHLPVVPHDSATHACPAFVGEVGQAGVGCSVHAQKPAACVAFAAGSPQCLERRAAHGLTDYHGRRDVRELDRAMARAEAELFRPMAPYTEQPAPGRKRPL